MIRRARSGDAAAIAELLGELGYPASSEEVQGRLDELGPDDLVLMAPEAAGMVALHRVPRIAEGSPFVLITALVVRREMRGRGVARALLAAAEEAGRRWGCSLLEVSSGRRPERTAAHRFYPAAGFTDTSPQSVRYRKPLRAEEHSG